MSEPIYDEDIVNLGYLKKVISDTEENIDDIYKNVSRHYASKPQPPYNKGDTWIDGDIVYVCINSRQIGLYTDSDWVTESGAREEVKNKNKTYLKQPSNYSPGDMWILQSDNDHKAGKKGEILISTAGRAEYDEGDWINMLGYGTIRSINEVADNLNNAINRIGNVEEAIEDGIIITFYQDSKPEGKHIGDLWYVTGEIEGYTKGKIYRYDGTSWVILDDPAIQKAFDEANEARIVADGKIQSFYSATEPTQNVGVGDLWIDIDNNNQLYRYNGTKWVAVYDTRINELVVNVETVTERVATIETDLGEIDLRVSETTTTITTIQGDVNDIQDNIVSLQSQIDGSIQFWNGSDIPTASNYPASDWTTEEEKNKHRADIYTVIEDIDGELKQGKSYRFDKVGDTWQWIELTDNELSAVQALAQSKAKVFVTTPKVPYSIGDLWLNNGKLFECQVAKDASGSYSQSDWKEAVNYTDDTVANLAKTLANNAQSTADSAVEGVSNITNTTGQAEGKNIHIEDSAEEPLVDISLHGETRQETSNQSSNLFDEEYYNNDEIYTEDTYKYTKARFVGNGYLHFKATLKEGKTAQTGVYIAISESAGKPYEEGTKTAYAISNGSAMHNYVDFTGVTDLYVNIYPKATKCATIFDNYDLWVSTNNVTYEKFIPDSPSPDYPSEIKNVEGKNKLNIDNLSNTAPSSNISIKDGVISQTSADTKTNLEWHLQTYNDSGYVGTIAMKTQNTTGIISHKFTKNSSFTALRFGLNGSQRNTMVYIPVNHLENNKTYTISANVINATQGSVAWTDMQIEEGTVATPYKPYNSLEVKVEGKNRFSSELVESFINRINNTEIARIDKRNGKEYLYFKANSGYVAGQNFTEHIQYLAKGIFEEKTQYTFSSKMIFNTERTEANICFRYTDGTYSVKHLSSKAPAMTEFDYSITSAPNKTVYSLSVFYEIGFTYIDLSTATLQKGTETNYEPYKSQTAYFPLAEGQKLMEGSYLADDGVHNKHSQALVNIEATVKLSNGNVCGVYYPKNKIYKNNNYIVYSNAIFTPSGHTLRFQEETIYENEANVVIVGNTNDTLATLKEKYDGAILEYELAEEEIVPYTEEQQEAWNKIKALATYKNITNITSDAYAKVVYMRDNGLDIYETKQNADKRYTETTEKFAETKITTDSIKDTVSTTQTTVANNYQELKGKFDDYAPKSDIITIQNSVEKIQTDTYTKTEINTKLKDGSVTKVLTTAGTFDENGLTIEKTNAKTKGNFNEKGITVMDATSGSSQELLFAGYDEELNETIVRSKNMTVEKYFVESNIARREEYSNPVLGGKGIGVFML